MPELQKTHNPLRGEVRVELAGNKFTLVPTFSSLLAIETEAELGLIEMAELLQQNKLRLETMVLVLSIASEPKLDVESMQKLIEKAGVVKAYEAVASFLASIITAS